MKNNIITALATHNVKLSRSSEFRSFGIVAQFGTSTVFRPFKLPCYKRTSKRHPLYDTYLNGAIMTLAEEAGVPMNEKPVMLQIRH
jgi:hypothetical protein